ncbi:Mobile element protein [Candidatus Enterovibrio altilux]|uniref:Mobile element protein n=1 Tax=Candidatus Enterovibrio altilux TaxID=1927128 RepID=A0A291BA95_9GAMM|nr:Mobile element protein [Candidatus Enterovibrio luxaltus]
MVKRLFSIPLRGLQEFINFNFKFTQLSLSCPYYSCINKLTKTIKITLKTQNKGTVQHLVIDSTRLKIYG